MRIDLLLRSRVLLALSLALSSATSAAMLSGCSKKADATAEVTAENISAEDAITEQHDAAAVTWSVGTDGKVKARLKAPDGAPIEDGVTGTVTAKPAGKDAKPVTAKLVFDAKAGLYTAELPKLEADLTEVSYDVSVKGKPVKGAWHLPKGGTRELSATAKVTAEVKVPEGKKGPNGGVIQVVGDDLLEIAADAKTGETRVYVLDDDLKPMPVGKRRVKIGVVASAPEVVVLSAEPQGLYFTGKLNIRSNPNKLTVVLQEEEAAEPVVVLCGWHPGVVVVVGPSAPSLGLFVAVGWGAPVIVVAPPTPNVVIVGHGKGKGKGKWGWGGRGPKVHINVH
jgi:hypothetical protein